MWIVPGDEMLSVEVKVSAQDRDQLHLGQTALMRMTAFNQRTTPEIFGEVSVIAADLVEDQRTGLQYYPVRLRDSRGRTGASWRKRSGAGHAGRDLHPDRPADDTVLSRQAAERLSSAGFPCRLTRGVSLTFRPRAHGTHMLCSWVGVRPWDWTGCRGTFVQRSGSRSRKTHDEEPQLQHRLQAPGRGGVPRRRLRFRSWQAARPVPQPGPDLVHRGWRIAARGGAAFPDQREQCGSRRARPSGGR